MGGNLPTSRMSTRSWSCGPTAHRFLTFLLATTKKFPFFDYLKKVQINQLRAHSFEPLKLSVYQKLLIGKQDTVVTGKFQVYVSWFDRKGKVSFNLHSVDQDPGFEEEKNLYFCSFLTLLFLNKISSPCNTLLNNILVNMIMLFSHMKMFYSSVYSGISVCCHIPGLVILVWPL